LICTPHYAVIGVRTASGRLLWQKKDAGLLEHFTEQLQDSRERDKVWDRYRIIRRYVESERCRHHQICVHFGETPKWQQCGMCDVCEKALSPVPAPRRQKMRLKASSPI